MIRRLKIVFGVVLAITITVLVLLAQRGRRGH